MKKIQITCTFLVCMAASIPTFAQWQLFGNNINTTDWFGAGSGSDIPLSFEHRYNHDDGYMIWRTTVGTTQERMRLTRAGWLGLNTPTPQMRFHVLDGGILATGDQGTNTVTGAGTRLMWIPDRAAFRALPIAILKVSKHQELQTFILNYVGCTFNHYFHLPDYRIGHPPQTNPHQSHSQRTLMSYDKRIIPTESFVSFHEISRSSLKPLRWVCNPAAVNCQIDSKIEML